MDLNLFINIFKKEPGNIPPRLAVLKAEVVGSGKGRGRQTRILFFVLLKFCFLLSRKTRKARKSSEFGIPNTTSLEEHKVLASCSLLTSQPARTEQDNASGRNATSREEAL